MLAFIDRINAHDVEGLGALMSDDHTFIDAHGNEVSGREKMIVGWRAYFDWFPDYLTRTIRVRPAVFAILNCRRPGNPGYSIPEIAQIADLTPVSTSSYIERSAELIRQRVVSS